MVREDALGEQHLLRREREEGRKGGGQGERKVRKGENRSMASEAAGTEADKRGHGHSSAMLCAGTKPHRPMPRAALLQSAEFKD